MFYRRSACDVMDCVSNKLACSSHTPVTLMAFPTVAIQDQCRSPSPRSWVTVVTGDFSSSHEWYESVSIYSVFGCC